jgi:uncharacterized protein YbjT (DUF2867 family)
MGRILVVGATGLIGAPVTRRLVADGHRVRLLVRDTARARTLDSIQDDLASTVHHALAPAHASVWISQHD